MRRIVLTLVAISLLTGCVHAGWMYFDLSAPAPASQPTHVPFDEWVEEMKELHHPGDTAWRYIT